MKVFSAKEMRELEKQAYSKGFSEETFMEKAGLGIANALDEYTQTYHLEKKVLLLCNKGNNSGDAYVAGRHLLAKNYYVEALQTIDIEEGSELCQKNYKAFVQKGGIVKSKIDLSKNWIILDGLFGTGFKGKIEEPCFSIITDVNNSKNPILSIDIPSGLNGNSGVVENVAIKATVTFFLETPKTGFFINDGWNHVGKLKKVSFGLDPSFIDQGESHMNLLTKKEMTLLVPTIKRAWHKYERGSLIAIAGSLNMPGAAILSTYAALKNGSGIVKLFHSPDMQDALSNMPVEIIREAYQRQHLKDLLDAINKANAFFIGPGIGRTTESLYLLKEVLNNAKRPGVIDADALTLLSKHSIKLPHNSVLTPHRGEALRLLQIEDKNITIDRLLKSARQFVDENNVTLVLKGAPTFIIHPGSVINVCTSGDPCMATAGSGDVLTGMIASFLSQGLSTKDASLLGVYMHGLAGELAANAHTSHAVVASDLIKEIGNVYKYLTPDVGYKI